MSSGYSSQLLSWLDRVEKKTGTKAPAECRKVFTSGTLTDRELDMYAAGVEQALNYQLSTNHSADANPDKPVYWLSEEQSDGSTRIRNLYGSEVFWLNRNGSSFNIGLSSAKLEEKFGGRGLLSGIYQMIAPDGSYLHDVKK